MTSTREIVEKASEVFGSRDEALGWLTRPAMALDQRVPMSIMRTHDGRLRVKTLLTQLEYCVYI
jgi:putative toxin-antitoxin system antitoxin component (TIGR02293 family)